MHGYREEVNDVDRAENEREREEVRGGDKRREKRDGLYG